ncbi:lytic transglycosylase domain-containing protein [Pyxidicoccus trucidator]|uniref:lytic transglycosylase domain-containing protein n=1 Tax=Pyxidicoccus trucidator TaxID=2709662 RepID=UPI0013DCD21F|nr:lytic transglycosylase domain-containing protein [Pyxidicoccus trucidator]
MGRKRAKGGGFDVPGWAWLVPCALVPVVLLNVGISWLGETSVSPLSFRFLDAKADALRAYAEHRPACLLEGHPELEPLITAAERRHRLPPGLLRALVQVESETRVHRISPAGAMGPGQLMPGTAEMLGVEDPFDPAPAVDASARYLAEQLRRFGDVRLAVAAYNAGPGAVDGRVPRNGETEHYVPKVLAAWKHTRPSAPPAAVAKRSPGTKTVARATAKPAPVTKPVARTKQAAPARAKPPASTSANTRSKPAVVEPARRG